MFSIDGAAGHLVEQFKKVNKNEQTNKNSLYNKLCLQLLFFHYYGTKQQETQAGRKPVNKVKG